MKTKELKIYVIALNVLFILAVLSSCSSGSNLTSLEYHQKLQKKKSYETYMSPKNRIKRAKDLQKAKAEQESMRRQEEKIRAKIRRIEGKDN